MDGIIVPIIGLVLLILGPFLLQAGWDSRRHASSLAQMSALPIAPLLLALAVTLLI